MTEKRNLSIKDRLDQIMTTESFVKSPVYEPADEDVVLGTMTDYEKAICTLHSETIDEYSRIFRSSGGDNEAGFNPQVDARLALLRRKGDLLREMLWVEIECRLPGSEGDNIKLGIDYQIIKYENYDTASIFMMSIFGVTQL